MTPDKMIELMNKLRLPSKIALGTYLFLLCVVTFWFIGLETPTTIQNIFAGAYLAAAPIWLTLAKLLNASK